MKRILCSMLAFWLVAIPANASENYIAIGDSLAAGQTPYQEIDYGYAGLIANQLSIAGQLSFFSKELAFPGFTTTDVIERIQEPVAQPLLEQATLITISAGANDVLPLVARDVAAGMISYNQISADFALNRVRKQMIVLLDELKARAPQAKVYVMGYYFAYPYVHANQKQGAAEQISKLNAILEQQAHQAGAIFVPLYDDFGLDATTYLPNPSDIHPNLEGYRVMANAFLRTYTGGQMSIMHMPRANPLSFEEIIANQQTIEQDVATARVALATVVTLFEGYDKFL
ncbi:SGNH/GDSL hydrolase family protein [Metalysinibacillus jejuensis]|uniref:SGNH/GDSL hydrolase family protein n=1 Tax=Metalysinibacillus jejuensis TaxID=914327 RepID=UPI000D3D518D|nr:SGNH/GDSL hydrolase family protein [Metalysinibacillus jejuensis]